jgi:hypothetical protein
MTGSRPLEGIPYGVIADARRGARSRTVDIPCPVCAPEHSKRCFQAAAFSAAGT